MTDSQDAADLANTLKYLRYFMVGLSVTAGGGGVFAALTFPARLNSVEQDHARMMATDSVMAKTQERMMQTQEYTACILTERIENRDPAICRPLDPRRRMRWIPEESDRDDGR